MADTLPTGEEEPEELDAEIPSNLDLGIELSAEEQAEAEAMVAHLKEQFGFEDETDAVDEPVETDEVEEPDPTDAEPVASEPPSARGVIVIDGVEVPVEEAVGYLAKREAQREIEAVRAQAPVEQPRQAEAPKPPEWLDQDDPAQMAMWTRQLELERQVSQIAGNQAQIAKQQAVARATADAETGISTFRTLHPELSEDDITKLRTHAAALDIIDGLARTRSGPDAVLKALDIAYWDHPEFRARAVAEPTPKQRKAAESAERKGKLNALGGSSGSAARTESKPDLSSDGSAKAAATAWLKEQNIL